MSPAPAPHTRSHAHLRTLMVGFAVFLFLPGNGINHILANLFVAPKCHSSRKKHPGTVRCYVPVTPHSHGDITYALNICKKFVLC
jgi:hypothetical protein